MMSCDSIWFDGVHSYADDDQQRGSAEVEVDAQSVSDPGRHRFKEVPTGPRGGSSRMPVIIHCGMSEMMIR